MLCDLWSQYSIHPNRHVCTLISGKVRLLILIEAKRQTLPEINVYTRLFGSIEYLVEKERKKLATDFFSKIRTNECRIKTVDFDTDSDTSRKINKWLCFFFPFSTILEKQPTLITYHLENTVYWEIIWRSYELGLVSVYFPYL